MTKFLNIKRSPLALLNIAKIDTRTFHENKNIILLTMQYLKKIKSILLQT